MRKKIYRLMVLTSLLCSSSLFAAASAKQPVKNQWAVELGSAFVFRNAYAQAKVGYVLNDVFPGLEAGALYGLGPDNFQALSHTAGLHVKQHVFVTEYFQPFLQAGVMSAFRSVQIPNVNTLVGASLGLGADGCIWGPWGYNAGVQLVFPDIYSRSPFVFKPELNVRYVF